MKIISIKAYEIIDSGGYPALEVRVELEDGSVGFGLVPRGSSKGKNEGFELRNGDKSRYFGMGLLKAKRIIEEDIAPHIVGEDAYSQRKIDLILRQIDKTPRKERIGANTTLGVSLAVCDAAANSLKLPLYKYIGGVSNMSLPVPLLNFINGGLHADNPLDIQEFLVIPFGFESFSSAIRAGCEIYYSLRVLLKERGYLVNTGQEGGFAPEIKNTQEAIEILLLAIKEAGYNEDKVAIGLDVSASNLFRDNHYTIDNNKLTSQELISFYQELKKRYPLVSIEDGLDEEDWEGWKELTERLSDCQIVGDDLFVTNKERLKKGYEKGAANAILIKPNQIGTLTETLDVIDFAKSIGYNIIISHRSGDLESSFIGDLAVGVGAMQIKAGAVSRGERTSKYNRLIRIEQEEGENIYFRGQGGLWKV